MTSSKGGATMTTAEILIHPNEILRQVSAPVETFDGELRDLASLLQSTMAAARGLGLAAPQIGVLRRVASVGKFLMVNPVIVWRSEELTPLEEGCLSIPGQRTLVRRPSRVEVEYFDVSGTRKRIKLQDKMAKCAQHEIDHLEGILVIDLGESSPLAA
jgi:peptide deformylase